MELRVGHLEAQIRKGFEKEGRHRKQDHENLENTGSKRTGRRER